MSKAERINRNDLRRSASVLCATAVLTLLTVSGCMVGPNYHPPETAVPTDWVGVAMTSKDQPAVATTEQPSGLTQWWRQFEDPTLTSLVEEAMEANLDLRMRGTRLSQARALRGVAIGGLWPSVTASGGYQLLHK